MSDQNHPARRRRNSSQRHPGVSRATRPNDVLVDHDEELIEALQVNPHDERARSVVRETLRELLLGHLIRLNGEGQLDSRNRDSHIQQSDNDRITEEDLHRVTDITVEEFLDKFLIGGRWEGRHKHTVHDVLVACGLDVLDELLRSNDDDGYVTLRRLVADLPNPGSIAAAIELVDETGATALAAALLIDRGEDPATVAAALDVPEEVVRTATLRFWTRLARLTPGHQPIKQM